MEPNYLHIWPRNTFMMIALPNMVITHGHDPLGHRMELVVAVVAGMWQGAVGADKVPGGTPSLCQESNSLGRVESRTGPPKLFL